MKSHKAKLEGSAEAERTQLPDLRYGLRDYRISQRTELKADPPSTFSSLKHKAIIDELKQRRIDELRRRMVEGEAEYGLTKPGEDFLLQLCIAVNGGPSLQESEV